MLFHKNRLILGPIKKVITAILKGIYALLKFFNLQITLLIGLVGLILFFSGVFQKNVYVELGFYILLILSIIYAVVASFSKALKLDKKEEKKRSRVDIVKEKKEQENEQTTIQPKEEKIESVVEEKPKYFKVKQNPNYIMAEYMDRYELLVKTESGLKLVRTDYKERI